MLSLNVFVTSLCYVITTETLMNFGANVEPRSRGALAGSLSDGLLICLGTHRRGRLNEFMIDLSLREPSSSEARIRPEYSFPGKFKRHIYTDTHTPTQHIL